ncbi:TPA: hypothetical protein ACJYA9_000768 [Pseudomonas aeruginosa]|nr:hypothetical protein [Pseudomonas aeruginosa]HCF3504827.1 hypothetical protein [Pseudomonas aeruginosa]
MSEVHRFSVVKMLSEAGNKISYDPHGPEIVMAKDYDALAAEAQALREEVEKAQNALAFTEQWHGVRYERLWHWAHAELDEEQKRRYFNIVANGTAEHSEPPTYARQLCRMKHRYECAEKEVAALRARVAVVPERMPRSSDIASIHQHSTGWNACLDELARLNGLMVSEGLLRRVCAEQPATCCMDDEMSWRRDRDSALIELRALLSEQA